MVSWIIESSMDKDYIFALAISKGWLEKKVQVKRYSGIDGEWYAIEPYEVDCNCPSLVPPPIEYEDYVGGE